MLARAYVHGKALPLLGVRNPGSVVLEVELDDGRTVQMAVEDNGRIFLRGWGNTPALLGNANAVEFRCQLAPEEQTHCPFTFDRVES
jgi:hypothetical protein